MDDDTEFLEIALQEYRESTWDDSTFADLPREAQHMILERAQQLKESSERSKVVAA